MAKKQARANNAKPPAATTAQPTPPPTPWYRKAWIVITVIASFLAALLATGPEAIENAEKMPAMIERVSHRFQAWLYEDSKWDGFYGPSPEAYADIEDLNISSVDMGLHLMVERGSVGGEITARHICKAAPLSHYLLLDGEVGLGGKTATIVAFDIVGGKRENYFQFTAQREGPVLTIAHLKGSKAWMPEPLRIAHYPTLTGEDAIYKVMLDFCDPERTALFKALRERPTDGTSADQAANENSAPKAESLPPKTP